jgi:hypothetical protein
VQVLSCGIRLGALHRLASAPVDPPQAGHERVEAVALEGPRGGARARLLDVGDHRCHERVVALQRV